MISDPLDDVADTTVLRYSTFLTRVSCDGCALFTSVPRNLWGDKAMQLRHSSDWYSCSPLAFTL